MLPKFTIPSRKKQIPMKQEAAPVDAAKKPRKPNWVRWKTVDGRLKRDWYPGFLSQNTPAGWAAERSAEERILKAKQCEAPF